MILHCVFLSVPASVDQAELSDVMTGLHNLVGVIDGFTTFCHGPNIDLEGKSPEAQYGFSCSFRDQAALERYADDSRHRAFGARLVALCGGAQKIKVYDIKTEEA